MITDCVCDPIYYVSIVFSTLIPQLNQQRLYSFAADSILSGWFVPQIMKCCLNLSKLWPKYCRSLFSGHGAYYYLTVNTYPAIKLLQLQECSVKSVFLFWPARVLQVHLYYNQQLDTVLQQIHHLQRSDGSTSHWQHQHFSLIVQFYFDKNLDAGEADLSARCRFAGIGIVVFNVPLDTCRFASLYSPDITAVWHGTAWQQQRGGLKASWCDGRRVSAA